MVRYHIKGYYKASWSTNIEAARILVSGGASTGTKITYMMYVLSFIQVAELYVEVAKALLMSKIYHDIVKPLELMLHYS